MLLAKAIMSRPEAIALYCCVTGSVTDPSQKNNSNAHLNAEAHCFSILGDVKLKVDSCLALQLLYGERVRKP